jgi:hypothetical protein
VRLGVRVADVELIWREAVEMARGLELLAIHENTLMCKSAIESSECNQGCHGDEEVHVSQVAINAHQKFWGDQVS